MITMKQRVIDAINHKQTDVTPWQIDLTTAFIDKIKKLEDVRDIEKKLGNHLFRKKYKSNTKISETEENDIFGVTWKKSNDGGDVGIVIGFPLKGKPLDSYAIPTIKKNFAVNLCRELENDKTGRFRMFSLTMLYYERAWSLRGMEDLLMDMCLDEAYTSALFERILNHHLELLDIVLEYDYEGVYFGDDWGQQMGLIMGPDMWRKYIKPGMKKLYEKVKSKGKFVIQHSCGDLREILPDLVDMGLDVYNTVQPEIYDLKELKKEYGKDLTFYGGISTQQFLPFATAEECMNLAKETLRIMGKGGGYILAPTHAVTSDIPFENIRALIEVTKNHEWN